MSLATSLAFAALVASVILLRLPARILPILAVLTSGLEVAMAFRLVTFGISGVSLPIILGAILTTTGGLMLAQANSKPLVSAATVVALVGLIQVVVALQLVS
ncbi:MAG: hypothetical protein MJE77_44160 [Proteobacteria bacterium]|nr:hypothetical protein [Pseudomonadota bacterium]